VWNELKYKVTVKTDYGDIPPVVCYPMELNQVFMNLLVNAAHAIEEQGTITIRTFQNGSHVCVQVADTGTGITPEVQRRLFEPFFTTKDVGQGTGLGLSMAHNIVVKRHAGKILVDSEEGAGTTFTVKIPLTN
jgi:two-component system NtrC family sensor kinase